MKRFAALSVAGLFTLASAVAVAAPTVITFDDIDAGSGVLMTNGYAGLDWDNFYVLNAAATYPGSGYAYGAISAPNVIFNGYAGQASFSSASAFNLLTIQVTKAWLSGVTHFDGYVGDTLTYSLNVSSSKTTPVLATFNWLGVNKVTISDGNGTYHTVLDNVTIEAVPEPETYAMVLAGLGLVGFAARRRKA